MAGLQRSVETFRRSGSSGLVWQDRFISDDQLEQMKKKGSEDHTEFRELRSSRSVGSVGLLDCNRSNGGGGGVNTFSSGKVAPVIDPPSPKVSGCGFCGIFGKPPPANSSKPRRR